MTPFLKTIAESYAAHYKDISRLTFVMPNKRSGSFLLKNFIELSETPTLAPRILSITDFIESVTPNIVDSRIDLLFRLYLCYKELTLEKADVSFEKFSSWGETLLSDFNEIDMHLVEPGALFKNIADLNSIRSNFLTEEQKRVAAEYFGYSSYMMEQDAEGFWMQFEKTPVQEDAEEKGAGEGKENLRTKFYTLWQLLGPLYHKFKKNLEADRLTTSGGSYRDAAERIEGGYEPFAGEKLVFVGFNALSESERKIFSLLKKMRVNVEGSEEPKADFIWDMVHVTDADEKDPSVKFTAANSRQDRFPMPEWIADTIEKSSEGNVPEIEVVAVPSNVMQVKEASRRLSEIYEKEKAEVQDARIAVILPDETLLLPLLHSLPKEYDNPNLTMGFPLKHTSVISFTNLLRRLHFHAKKSGDHVVFFLEDVKDLLKHPYALSLFKRKDIEDFLEVMEKKRRQVATMNDLASLGENAKSVFVYFPEEENPVNVVKYLLGIMRRVYESMGSEKAAYLNSSLEKAYIANFIDGLIRFENGVIDYDIVMTAPSVFSMISRMLGGEKIAFEGEPLQGLQIMGVLETRCLDFDRIVMLSVNEKVMPRVGRNTTFIPNVLRYDTGMPPANYQEEVFAYYFYRLIGRSKHCLLTYDSRTSDSRTPGPSRYILQMKYLNGNLKYVENEAGFRMPSNETKILKIEKRGEIAERLKRYHIKKEKNRPSGEKKDKDQKNFSSSALGDYFSCPLKFLFKDVLEMYEEREPTETIDAIDLGSIIHGTIEKLYISEEEKRNRLLATPIVITPDFLRTLLVREVAPGKSFIAEVAKREILKHHYKLKEEADQQKGELYGSAAILLDFIVKYVKKIILADLKNAPFRLWGTEIKENLPYTLPDGLTVNLKMVIDRLDQEGATDPDAPFRIVDYKTGLVHLEAAGFESLFNGSKKASNIFQLIFYAELLVMLAKRGDIELPVKDLEEWANKLQLQIYAVLILPKDKGKVIPEIGAKKIVDLGALRDYEKENEVDFMGTLEETLSEILDCTIPFESTPTDTRCQYCPYRLRCDLL